MSTEFNWFTKISRKNIELTQSQNNLISSPVRAVMSLFYPLCNLANTWCQRTGWDLPCLLGLQHCMVLGMWVDALGFYL